VDFLFLSFPFPFALALAPFLRSVRAFPVPVPLFPALSQHSTFLNPWFKAHGRMAMFMIHDTIDRHCEFLSLLTRFLFLFLGTKCI
jgi:hypothetical protein